MALNFLVNSVGSTPTSPVVSIVKLPLSGGVLVYDFSTTSGTAGTFVASPATPTYSLSKSTVISNQVGCLCYGYYASPPAAAFTDGYYVYEYFDSSNGNSLGQSTVLIESQSDQVISGGGSGATAQQIATALWQDLLSSGDFGTTGSVGAALKTLLSIVFPNNFGKLQIDATTGILTAKINETFPNNFQSLAIDPTTGAVTANSSGGSSAVAVSGVVASGSSATAVIVSSLPANRNYVGQRLYHSISGESRLIVSQNFASGNYTFNFGGGVGQNGGFGVAPNAGDVVYPIP